MAYSSTDGSAVSGQASNAGEMPVAAESSLTESANAWLKGLRSRVVTGVADGSLASIESMILGVLLADPPDVHQTLWMRLHDRPIGRLGARLAHCKPTPTGLREILTRLELLRETTFFLASVSMDQAYAVARDGAAQQLLELLKRLDSQLVALWAEYDEGAQLLDAFDDDEWADGGKVVQDLLAALKQSTDALDKALTVFSYEQPTHMPPPTWTGDSPFTVDVFLSFLSRRQRVLTQQLMNGDINADSIDNFAELTGAWDDAFATAMAIAKAKHQQLRVYEIGAQRLDLQALVTHYVPRR